MLSDIQVLLLPVAFCAAVLVIGLCASIFNPPNRYYWQTPKHVKIGILKAFIDLYVHPSCTQIKDGSQFDVMFIGRGFFPFFGAVWAVLFDYGSIESAIFILAWCAVPYLNIFAYDGLLSTFCRYIFYAITKLTLGTGYFLIPFVLSCYKGNYVAFSWLLIITPVMFIVNTLINMYYRRYTENKFGFDEIIFPSLKRYSLSLWDYWCLKKIRAASQNHMELSDFIAQYIYEVKRTEEESYIAKIRLEYSLTQQSKKPSAAAPVVKETPPESPVEAKPGNTYFEDSERLSIIENELKKFSVPKIKKWHAEGRITDEQFRTIAKRYNQLKKERNEIQERLALLEYIDKKESE